MGLIGRVSPSGNFRENRHDPSCWIWYRAHRRLDHAGRLAGGRVFILPFLAVLAVQTWGLAAGDGVSPPDTVYPFSGAISYYVVQAIILAVTLAIALLLGAVRSRGARSRGAEAGDGLAGTSRSTVVAAVAVGLLTAAFVTFAVIDAAPHSHKASGNPPLQGFIGLGVILISLIVLGVTLLAGHRSDRRGLALDS